MQDTHFIRYFSYYFDTNDPYFLGNSEITKSNNYNYSSMYYSISDDNFNASKSDVKSFYNDYNWRSQTRNPYTSPNTNTKYLYQYFTDPVQISSSKSSDLYRTDINYHHSIFPSYKNANDRSSSNYNYNLYDTAPSTSLTPCHHYQSNKYYNPALPSSFNFSSYYYNNNSDTTPSTDFTFHQHPESMNYNTTTPSTDLTSRQHLKNINSNHKPPSTDLTVNHYQSPQNHHIKSHSYSTAKLSDDDRRRQKISRENHAFVKRHQNLIDTNIETIDEIKHSIINIKITRPTPRKTPIIVTRFSTIDTAIYYHNQGLSKICVLNFADAVKVGGGYLNGRNAQEECLCRQTLLYPTLKASTMHQQYRADRNLYVNDYMVYSPNVYVIRDNSNAMLEIPFKINVISAPAVDNRNEVKNNESIMERRIRKIIKLAAYKQNKVLVLGAFGCGVFKNNPSIISRIFAKVLISEGLKDYFDLVVFPIYNDDKCKKIFENVLM